MARVSGKRRRKVVPRPSAVSICTVPFSRASTLCTTSRSHAAAGELGDFFRGGESRLQDQIQRLGPGQAGCLLGFQQSLGQGALPDFFRINASPVVEDLDDHLVALVISAQPQGSLRPLAGAHALRGRLDAMADRIAHQVGQRLGDRIQNALVEIGLPAPDDQLHFFSALSRNVTDHARKAAKQLIDRHHANLHDRVLQVVQHPPLECHGIGELSAQDIFREALSKFEQRLLQHRFRQDQFADQIEYAVDSFRIHAQQVVGAAGHGGRRACSAGAGASFAGTPEGTVAATSAGAGARPRRLAFRIRQRKPAERIRRSLGRAGA